MEQTFEFLSRAKHEHVMNKIRKNFPYSIQIYPIYYTKKLNNFISCS